MRPSLEVGQLLLIVYRNPQGLEKAEILDH